MDLGWVVMTQVGTEEVRTSRWTLRQRSRWTTGGTSGSTSMSLKLSDIDSGIISMSQVWSKVVTA